MDQITLLWWLTGIYLAILVLVLAFAVGSVLFYLWRIGTTLRAIANGLSAVEGHTRPLGEKLGAANAGLGAIAGSLSSARDHLVATDAALATLTSGGEERVA